MSSVWCKYEYIDKKTNIKRAAQKYLMILPQVSQMSCSKPPKMYKMFVVVYIPSNTLLSKSYKTIN